MDQSMGLNIPYILNGQIYRIQSQKDDKVMVQCRHCPLDRVYRGSIRSTGNFHMHIKRRHPELMMLLNKMKARAHLERRIRSRSKGSNRSTVFQSENKAKKMMVGATSTTPPPLILHHQQEIQPIPAQIIPTTSANKSNSNPKLKQHIPYILNGELYEIQSQDGENVTVKCCHCPLDRVYRGSIRSTGNFHMHIKRRHPDLMPLLEKMKLRAQNERSRVDKMEYCQQNQRSATERITEDIVMAKTSALPTPLPPLIATPESEQNLKIRNVFHRHQMQQQLKQKQHQKSTIETPLNNWGLLANSNDGDCFARQRTIDVIETPIDYRFKRQTVRYIIKQQQQTEAPAQEQLVHDVMNEETTLAETVNHVNHVQEKPFTTSLAKIGESTPDPIVHGKDDTQFISIISVKDNHTDGVLDLSQNRSTAPLTLPLWLSCSSMAKLQNPLDSTGLSTAGADGRYPNISLNCTSCCSSILWSRLEQSLRGIQREIASFKHHMCVGFHSPC